MLVSGEVSDTDKLCKAFQKKGKAVEIEHFLFDELWNMGSRKTPKEILFREEQAATGEEGADADASLDEEKQGKEEEGEGQELTVQEWDDRIVEAFKRAIFEAIIDQGPESQLPMEPSDFQKILQEYSLEDHTKLDLKKTSFKKIGKLLECMSTAKSGEGLVDYSTEKQKGGHKIINNVYKGSLKDFVPQFKLRRTKNKASTEESKQVSASGELGDCYPKVQIDEVY